MFDGSESLYDLSHMTIWTSFDVTQNLAKIAFAILGNCVHENKKYFQNKKIYLDKISYDIW